jgi:hypothetical protein
MNPKWDKTLIDAIQSVVRDPVDPTDLSAPTLHATVKFTFLNGVVEYPEIVQSTGNTDLDKLMLRQVASAPVPVPTGRLQTEMPHEFIVDLDMPTPVDMFRSKLYTAIDYSKVYPKEAIISGDAANVTVGFDYQDGKASSITLTRSSKVKSLDKASLDAVTRTAFPSALPVYAVKSLHTEVVFCYTMASAINGPPVTIKNECPASGNVVVVRATRIMRTDVQVVHGTRGE